MSLSSCPADGALSRENSNPLTWILHYIGAVRCDTGPIAAIYLHPMTLIRRFAFVTLCGIAVALLPAAASAAWVRADLDGDGARDRVSVGAKLTELDVRFAHGRRTLRLPAGDFILRFLIADVDRDGDPDVVADTRRSGLKIWINKGRGRFVNRSHRFRTARRSVRQAIHGVQNPREDDSAVNDRLRTFGVLPATLVEPLVTVRRLQTGAAARTSRSSHRRRIPRGPPTLLVV